MNNYENRIDTFAKAMEAGFESQIKKVLEDSIVSKKMEELEKDVRSIVKRELESFTVGSIERMRDVMRFNEMLDVSIRYSDGEEFRKDDV